MVERKRHLAKAVSYRFFGSIGTAAAAYGVTGDVKVGTAIGAFDAVAKIGLYYIHERAWYRIRWGVRDEQPDPRTLQRAEIRNGYSLNGEFEGAALAGILNRTSAHKRLGERGPEVHRAKRPG